MSITHRVKRTLGAAAAGAMVLSLLPAGAAFADYAETCEGSPDTDNVFDDGDEVAEIQEPFVDCLWAYGITEGDTDNDFNPGDGTTRQHMALFVARTLSQAEDGDLTIPADENDEFSDISDVNPQEARHAINWLEERGIVTGYDDGTYRPGPTVPRGQMATFVVRLLDAIGVAIPANPPDHFSDDNGSFHEDNINALAEMDIVGGFADGTFRPNIEVTRQQMAAFIIGAAIEADEAGLWNGVMVNPEPPTTNQDYTVSPAAAQSVQTNDSVDFTVSGITASTVDIALFECDDVTNTGGTITFADANDDDAADWNTADTAAVITEVNDVQGTYGDYVNNAAVENGGVTFTVTSSADECVAPVVFNDADNDDALDLDANNEPTEEFGVGSKTTFGTVAAVNATPESEINRYGTNHTITAALEDAPDGDTVALDGEMIRFQVIRGATTCDTVNDSTTGGTVVATGSDTTEDGVATFTYTLADPDPDTAGDTDDCIVAFWDENNNGLNDDGFQDVVSKTWSDADATATTLDLTPETDTNLVGTQHTVTATVTDQFGDPVDSTVRFEVYRDGATTSTFATDRATGSDGVVTFTYTGPAADADDVIVACVEDAGDADTVCSTDGGLTFDAPGDSAEKYWVEQADATTGDVVAADVIGFDTAADNVDVEDTAGNNLRLLYDADDQFTVDTVPATLAEFEAALSRGDTLTVSYNPDGVSTFALTNS